ncbi:MAG: DUF1232 domain-containing protein [Chloroflexi bacterium]|nr:DUF1232 domain-containing protein [Chloroflexota bacterium]
MLRGIFLLIRSPGLLRLIPRLMFDGRVPMGAKLFVVGAIVYLVSPIDLLPDMLPIRGRLDDILVLLISAASFLGATPKEVLDERNGDGKQGPEGHVIEGTYRVEDDDEPEE